MNCDTVPIFVYGTLLTGESAHELLSPHVEKVMKAILHQTSLYDLGPYPMAVDGHGHICGEACWLADGDNHGTLEHLDRYEGSAYKRVLRAIEGETWQAPIHAWVYLGRDLPTSATIIVGGDWRQRNNT